jgi:hypothetical protein
MTTTPRRPLAYPASIVLALFLGLCTLFALVVTAAESWQEHSQSQWPQATARVETCELTRSSSGRRNSFYIRCRLRFAIGTERVAAKIYSGTVPSREVAQYPPNQIEPLETWVSEHPTGAEILVRYDPAKPTRVVLASLDMPPYTGTKTTKNLKLLTALAAALLLVLAIARLTRPQPD